MNQSIKITEIEDLLFKIKISPAPESWWDLNTAGESLAELADLEDLLSKFGEVLGLGPSLRRSRARQRQFAALSAPLTQIKAELLPLVKELSAVECRELNARSAAAPLENAKATLERAFAGSTELESTLEALEAQITAIMKPVWTESARAGELEELIEPLKIKIELIEEQIAREFTVPERLLRKAFKILRERREAVLDWSDIQEGLI
jgi:hypothetical protein